MDARKDTLPGQYLTFSIADEEYGVALPHVREIVEYGGVTVVPGTPPWIRGVMNLRGRVLAVVDLAMKLGLPPSQPTKFTCVLVTEVDLAGETALMGVMSDAVREVVDLGPEKVEPPPSFGTRVRVEYVLGMGKVGRRLAVLLDIQRVLSAEELLTAASLGEAESGATEGTDASPAASDVP